MDDVGAADEPLQGRGVPLGPERVQGAGGHGPLPGGHASRKPCLNQPAAAPAHGVGPHVHTRPLGQGSQGAVAEGTDARREPEQGRGVERDAQAPGLAGPGRVESAQVVIAPSMERIAPVT